MTGKNKGRKIVIERIVRKIRENQKYNIVFKSIIIGMFLLGVYFIVYPFIPALVYRFTKKGKEVYPYKTGVMGVTEENEDVVFEDKEIPEENRLVIPMIDVDMPIVEGPNSSVLDLGVWHRPGTGTPGSGNMVLTGHRFGYAFLPEDVRNSTSFYNLDKLNIGDLVLIYWNKTEYIYEVYEQEIVDKTNVSIEEQIGEEKLTLYTCHPLGSNDQRLVYYAKRTF